MASGSDRVVAVPSTCTQSHELALVTSTDTRGSRRRFLTL